MTYQDFLKILPSFGIKAAVIAQKKGGKYLIGQITLIKKLVIKSFINRFWSLITTSERKDSLFHVYYSCENTEDIFQSSKNLYYYPETIEKFNGFIRAPQTSLSYAWQSDLDDIISSPETIKGDRRIFYIWSSGNEGKTHYIKHKCMNSKIFGFFCPLSIWNFNTFA